MKTNRTIARPLFTHPLAGLLLFAFVAALLGHPQAAMAKSKKKTAKADTQSHNFFAFADANYYTSPDQRIGAKLLIDSARVGPTLSALQHLTFLPTAHVKPHRHVYVTEILYIIKGNLTVRIGQETKVMGPDTAAYIPPQTFHEYLNTGSDVCQTLQFYSPSGPEEEYRNWEKPGDKPKEAGTASATPKEEKNIVRGPLPPIPGSPLPMLQRVDEETLQPRTASSTTAHPPSRTTPATVKARFDPSANRPGSSSLDLQLKTRFDRANPGH